jgi:hypothetical protein
MSRLAETTRHSASRGIAKEKRKIARVRANPIDPAIRYRSTIFREPLLEASAKSRSAD